MTKSLSYSRSSMPLYKWWSHLNFDNQYLKIAKICCQLSFNSSHLRLSLSLSFYSLIASCLQALNWSFTQTNPRWISNEILLLVLYTTSFRILIKQRKLFSQMKKKKYWLWIFGLIILQLQLLYRASFFQKQYHSLFWIGMIVYPLVFTSLTHLK